MTDTLRDTLTFVVPTYNRYDRLLRLLGYYRATGCSARMRILDSSSDAAPGGGALQSFASPHGATSITRYDSKIPALVKMLDGLEAVATPYVALWADDDFLVPRTCAAGVRILEQQPQVSVVHGRSALFHVETGHVRWVAPYLQRDLRDATASARLRNHLQGYSVTFYSLHRTEALTRNLRQVCRLELDWHTWGEIALSCLGLIEGQAMSLPDLYMVREGHADMTSLRMHQARGLDTFDWLTDTTFSSRHGRYETFRDCLAPALMRQDGLTVHQAHQVIKQAFWSYLVPHMEEQWRGDGGATMSAMGRLQEAARRVPGLRNAWRAVRSRMPDEVGACSLEALLRPSSRHHRDFLPIYRAIVAADGARASGVVRAPGPDRVAGRAGAVSG